MVRGSGGGGDGGGGWEKIIWSKNGVRKNIVGMRDCIMEGGEYYWGSVDGKHDIKTPSPSTIQILHVLQNLKFTITSITCTTTHF